MASDFSGSHAATSDTALTAVSAYKHSFVHRARRSLGFAFLVCAAFVLTLTSCDSEGMLTADSSERDTALRILRVDSRMLAYADVDDQIDMARQMMGMDAEEQVMMEEGLERVFEMSGIRIDEDVHAVYMGLTDFSDAAEGGIVAFVDYDPDAVANQAASMDEVVRIDTGWPADAYTLKDQDNGAAIAFAEGSLVVLASSRDYLETMLDRAYEEGGLVSTDDMLSEVADRKSWMIVRGIGEYTNEIPESEMPIEIAMARPLLTSLEDMAIGMNQDTESMDATVLIRPSGSVTVEDYANLLSGVRAMMRLQLRDLDVAMEMIDDIEIKAENEWVALSLDFDHADMERLGDELREEMGATFN
jgi:hypothetical protein